ncbi:MAG: hypothetical protein E7620_07095 [Ruminococcaceae bacterium]|nr:hypothetical protein [Oscillospiraceae bacterium]
MKTYYIDLLNGCADADGLSPSHARNAYADLPLEAGDTVLFRCGSFVRDCLHTVPFVRYGAYGDGELPTFCGSLDVSRPTDWAETQTPNVWKCLTAMPGDVGNLVFNENDCTATLRWEMRDLRCQGDFYGHGTVPTEQTKTKDEQTTLYLYSAGNPALVYSHIEAVPYNHRQLVKLRQGITLEDLRFINSGVHGMAGQGDHITVRGCVFENIGGCPWSRELRIRFGNGLEIWHFGNHILVEDCFFKNVYDSCVTHQGPGEDTRPAEHFICRHCVFDTYGMAAFEYRDKLPVASVFEENVCLNAGCGFAMLGEELPRKSEIWPQPMGHHIFLWRIPSPTEGGSLRISGNRFGAAPVGAAIYSIISPEAEAQITLENNLYTPNSTLLVRFGGENHTALSEYQAATGKDAESSYASEKESQAWKKAPRGHQNADVYLQLARRSCVTNVSIFAIFTVFFLALLINLLLPKEALSAEELFYNNYTFMSYERIATGGRHRSYHYEITVTELEEPLIIDNIVEDRIDRKQLDALRAGDTVTVSLQQNSRKQQEVLFLSHKETELLPYEVYLQAHASNNTIGIVVCSCLSLAGVVGIVVDISLYKRTTRKYQQRRDSSKGGTR